ncbi:MAG TPA: GGDEF domain-containing protein [Steroidobacter sp.]|jgi:diguanylate cyclase|nr:GGDEF domain-containing protein [Steroidobacteraceae bacterium]HLS82856.1 GGDEF domain-containing protein [Steroidobacter sp.]
MRYTETREKSVEILRRALSLMAKQEAAYHPQSYTIWYEHAAGINPRLSEVLDKHFGGGRRLTDEDAWRLHAQYVIARDEEVVERMQRQLQVLLDDTTRIAVSAGVEATQFTQTLQLHRSQLLQSAPVELLQSIVADLVADAERMRSTTTELAEQLEGSVREVRKLTEQLERAQQEALLDPLTGLLNRRGFERRLEGHPYDGQLQGGALLIADIDRFKSINDTHGHVLGDKVIRSVAQTLCSSIKGRDVAARLGGEEFAAYLPQTSLKGAAALAEQIRAAVASGRIRRGDEQLGAVTLSIGVATARAGESLEHLIARADAAMYAAKAAGRNRVSFADPES